jgi:phage-related minor tail protein
LEKLFGSSIKGQISLARLAQGSKEFNDASNEEIADVVRAWEELDLKSML